MPTTDLTPGTVTTLGQLRPGDVGEWPDTGERFLVTERNRYTVLRYAEAYCAGRGYEQVRYLGRGRIEPARIVMEGEPNRVAELESQVRTLTDPTPLTVEKLVEAGFVLTSNGKSPWDLYERASIRVVVEESKLTWADFKDGQILAIHPSPRTVGELNQLLMRLEKM